MCVARHGSSPVGWSRKLVDAPMPGHRSVCRKSPTSSRARATDVAIGEIYSLSRPRVERITGGSAGGQPASTAEQDVGSAGIGGVNMLLRC